MGDLHKIWSHRWITPKAECRKSKIHGHGVFAKKFIKKGEIVAIFGGIVVPKKDIKEYRRKVGHLGLQIDDGFFICPTNRKEVEKTGTFNHSCDSNCGCLDSIRIIAIQNIKTGEELTFDEAFTETFFESLNCNCGSPNCRKIIKPTDWKIPKLQQKYKKYFSPYLKAKL